ncbi:MAG: diacylglycerol kinase family lipid kinase [Anaerolineales bacterium]|jgi:diacylglycerol kinase (ATP)
MAKYRLIVNPISGRGAGVEAIPMLRQELSSAGLDFDLELTQRPWHAAELARSAVGGGCEHVVAVGGDGTANEVLNGLMQARDAGEGSAVMGVIGIGRGNDFAYGMGVPVGLKEGCEILCQGYRRTVDVGCVTGGLFPNGRYFGNGVGIGFDAVVGFEALKMKRLTGFLSYVVAALKTMFLYYKAPTVRIEYNEEKIEIPALMVSIMNGRRMGGGFMMAPQGIIDDGQFDVCIAEEVGKATIFALILRFMQGTQASHRAIRVGRTDEISVSALRGSLPAHADGETLCTEGDRLTMKIVPRQLEMITAR